MLVSNCRALHLFRSLSLAQWTSDVATRMYVQGAKRAVREILPPPLGLRKVSQNFRPGIILSSVQFSSVQSLSLVRLFATPCSTPGLPVHWQFPEFTQTHVHWVSDAIQPSHFLSSPSPLGCSFREYAAHILPNLGFTHKTMPCLYPFYRWEMFREITLPMHFDIANSGRAWIQTQSVYLWSPPSLTPLPIAFIKAFGIEIYICALFLNIYIYIYIYIYTHTHTHIYAFFQEWSKGGEIRKLKVSIETL